MNLEQIKAHITCEFEATNQLILKVLSSDVPLAKEIADYIVQSGGKRIRPMLVLLTAKALGYTGNAHIELSAIIELLHTATLLHDDVVDHSEMRRGRPTANNKWGNEASVLVGDLLHAKSFQMITELDHKAVSQLIADSTSLIVEGEILQLSHTHDIKTTEATYLEIIKRKTGQLFAVATACMPVICERSAAEVEALRSYGYNLGIAFQILDDALDYSANPETTGKNLGDDLAEGKPTLPLIYIMKNGSKDHVELVSNALTQQAVCDINAIQQAILDCNAIEYTIQRAKHFSQIAIDNIAFLPESETKEALIALATFASNRDK